jgi:FkbM family methyltransferase
VLGESVDLLSSAFTPVAKHSVLAFRLDDLIDEFRIPPPTHIKLDVDGLEYRVIAGAQRTLASAVTCDVWVEVTETCAADPRTAWILRCP